MVSGSGRRFVRPFYADPGPRVHADDLGTLRDEVRRGCEGLRAPPPSGSETPAEVRLADWRLEPGDVLELRGGSGALLGELVAADFTSGGAGGSATAAFGPAFEFQLRREGRQRATWWVCPREAAPAILVGPGRLEGKDHVVWGPWRLSQHDFVEGPVTVQSTPEGFDFPVTGCIDTVGSTGRRGAIWWREPVGGWLRYVSFEDLAGTVQITPVRVRHVDPQLLLTRDGLDPRLADACAARWTRGLRAMPRSAFEEDWK
jgi:hypothetical protein